MRNTELELLVECSMKDVFNKAAARTSIRGLDGSEALKGRRRVLLQT